MMSAIPFITSCAQCPRPDLNAVIVETSASLIVVYDRAGRVVRFNRACEEATGYGPNDVRGRAFWEFLCEGEQAGAARDLFETMVAGGEFPRTHEGEWVARDGGRRRIVWSNSVVRDSSGAVELVVACGIDITDRKRV